MAHYALLDEENIVTQVIVGKDEDETWQDQPMDWEAYYGGKRTSYNTRGGMYYNSETNEPDPDQSKAYRKNFAGIGFSYDESRDAFIPPKSYPSWILDEFSCLWNSPVAYPNDGQIYVWNEETQEWEVVNN
jgi:hypothetical protein